MPRPRSQKVQNIKAMLMTRLADESRPAGTRFLSTRATADLYGISYQTAHRLLAELAAEGRVERRGAAGTFRPGKPPPRFTGVHLLFDERAKQRDSFGWHLLRLLRQRMEREHIPCRVTFTKAVDIAPAIPRDRLPVIWESPLLLDRLAAERRQAVLLNDRPAPGHDSLWIDSVGVDDYSGGATAGQLLADFGKRSGFDSGDIAILAGPAADRRSTARVAGCRSVLGQVKVVHAGSWYREDGIAVASRLLRLRPRAVFCCNDRLAEAVTVVLREGGSQKSPSPSELTVVGFDDAPIAETLGLTTIAIPWDELVGATTAVIQRRIAGDGGAGSHQVLAPRPVIRPQIRHFSGSLKYF